MRSLARAFSSSRAEHAFLGPRLFFVAPGTAKSNVKTMQVKRLLKALCFPDVGV
jgi:hypothetical protein